ncbi:MAG: MFS transporter, partial [Thermomicrobiales bacterium]
MSNLSRVITSRFQPLTGTFSGWRMVLVSALVVYAAAPGMTYGTTAFVDPLTSELGISRSLFSSAYAFATIASAIVLLLIGRYFDRWGSRRLMTAAIVGLGIGVLWLSFSAGPIGVFIGFAITRTFGQGIMPLASRILIPHWFLRHRGRAYSAIGIAGTMSIATLPPVHEWLITQVGWRALWRIDALVLIVALAPFVWWRVRDLPEDIGQQQDGRTTLDDARPVFSDANVGTTLAAARRTYAFWALVAASLVPMGIITGLSLYQVGIYEDLGYPSSLAGLTFTIESVSMFAATLWIGARLDRINLRFPLLASQVLMLAAMIVLITGSSLWIGLLYAILRGAATGIALITADVAWASWYGRQHLGSIRGFAAAVGVFISALGPLPLGLAIDRFDSYTPAILSMMLLPV